MLPRRSSKRHFYPYQKALLNAGAEVSNSLYSYQTALESKVRAKIRLRHL